MSKYSMEELVDMIGRTVISHRVKVDEETINAIIARLRAGDKLCEAVLEDHRKRVSPGIDPRDIMSIQTRKAVAEFEGKP